MKLCKASGIEKNASWWTTTITNQETELARKKNIVYSRERGGEKELLKEIVGGELIGVVNQELPRGSVASNGAFYEGNGETRNGFHLSYMKASRGSWDIRIPRAGEGVFR